MWPRYINVRDIYGQTTCHGNTALCVASRGKMGNRAFGLMACSAPCSSHHFRHSVHAVVGYRCDNVIIATECNCVTEFHMYVCMYVACMMSVTWFVCTQALQTKWCWERGEIYFTAHCTKKFPQKPKMHGMLHCVGDSTFAALLVGEYVL